MLLRGIDVTAVAKTIWAYMEESYLLGHTINSINVNFMQVYIMKEKIGDFSKYENLGPSETTQN